MVVSCWVKGCSNRADGKSRLSFFRIPKIRETEGEDTRILSEERRRVWLANINREVVPSLNSKICSDHFITGKPSYLHDRLNPDWAPTLKLDSFTSRKSRKKLKQANTDFDRMPKIKKWKGFCQKRKTDWLTREKSLKITDKESTSDITYNDLPSDITCKEEPSDITYNELPSDITYNNLPRDITCKEEPSDITYNELPSDITYNELPSNIMTYKESTRDIQNWTIDCGNSENTADSCGHELENQIHENNSCEFSPFVTVKCEFSPFLYLKESLKTSLKEHWYLTNSENEIKIFELYNPPGNALSVKQSVTIEQDFSCKIFVHRQEIPHDHIVWTGLPVCMSTVEDVNALLTRLDSFSVCFGNFEEEYKEIVASEAELKDGFTSEIRAYREADFCAFKGDLSYDSTVRSVKCKLLVEGNRCDECLNIRRILRKRKQRLEERKYKIQPNYLHSKYQHKYMDRDMLLTKIEQQRNEIKILTAENDKLKRKSNIETLADEVIIDEIDHVPYDALDYSIN